MLKQSLKAENLQLGIFITYDLPVMVSAPDCLLIGYREMLSLQIEYYVNDEGQYNSWVWQM